jgi:hypothetical protein
VVSTITLHRQNKVKINTKEIYLCDAFTFYECCMLRRV